MTLSTLCNPSTRETKTCRTEMMEPGVQADPSGHVTTSPGTRDCESPTPGCESSSSRGITSATSEKNGTSSELEPL